MKESMYSTRMVVQSIKSKIAGAQNEDSAAPLYNISAAAPSLKKTGPIDISGLHSASSSSMLARLLWISQAKTRTLDG